MKLLSNWQNVLKRAWSVRLLVVAAILSGCEVLLPIIRDFIYPIPSYLFAGMSFIFTVAAALARLVAQNNLTKE